MGINFPTAPANGTTLTVGSITYTYSSAKGIWVTSKALPTAEPFNYIVNPAFQASQEKGDDVLNMANGNIADQWFYQAGAGLIPASYAKRDSTMPVGYVPGGSKSFIQMQTLSAATVGTNDYGGFYHPIEGQFAQTFFQGGAQSKQSILRFWVNATLAATYGGALRSTGTPQRTFPFSFVISAAQVGTWVKVEVIIPGDTAGVAASFPKDSTYYAQLWICFATGSYYGSSPAGAWASNFAIAPTGINSTWPAFHSLYLANVGLYRDPNLTGRAPLWEAPDIVLSQRQAMRYWYRSWYANGASNTTTLCGRAGMPHPVQMRIAPALTEVGAMSCQDGGLGAIASIGAVGNSAVYEANHTTGANLTVGRACHQQGAYASAYIAVSAR